MNSSTGRLEAKHGGKIMFGDGFFCHTFAGLVPPEKYFKEHPEYFSLVNGKRQDGYAQLCCTNEDVIRLCTEGILQGMRAAARSVRVLRLAERLDKHCECDKCQALAKQEDSQMAPVLELVNRVAEAVGKGVSRQGRRDAGLPVDPPAAEDHAAAAERDHPAVLDRVLLLASAGQLRQPGQPGVLPGPGRLGQDLRPALGLGLRDRFLALPAAVPEPAGPRRQHPVVCARTTSRASSSRTPTTRRTANWRRWAAT